MLKSGAGKTKAPVVVPVARAAAVPVRNRTVVVVVGVPAAATVDAVGRRRAIKIIAPFPYIAAHVVKPQLVGLHFANFMAFATRISTVIGVGTIPGKVI